MRIGSHNEQGVRIPGEKAAGVHISILGPRKVLAKGSSG